MDKTVDLSLVGTIQKLTSDNRNIFAIRREIGESGYTYYNIDIGGFICFKDISISGTTVNLGLQILTPNILNVCYSDDDSEYGELCKNSIREYGSGSYQKYYDTVPRIFSLDGTAIYSYTYVATGVGSPLLSDDHRSMRPYLIKFTLPEV